MNLVEKAELFATSAHSEQKRKYTFEPYIVHPREVVDILRSVDIEDEEMLSAAWLHDVVEDCGVPIELIYGLFGSRVGKLVSDLTDVSKPTDGNRATRKTLDLHHTAAADPDSKTIKLADLISNTKSIVKHDPDFARVYLHEKARLLEVLTEGNEILLIQARASIQ